jgi:hypothetical protein
LVLIMIFIFLLDWLWWRGLNPEHQFLLLTIPAVACIFIVFGIRFSIMGLIEEFHLRSPPPMNPLLMANMENDDSFPTTMIFNECSSCKKGIPADGNVCCYCGEKIEGSDSIN